MSDTSSLSELARFVGRSALSSEDAGLRLRTVNAIASGFMPKRRGVSDLLGAVLALSARTRRMVLPRVDIDIDVFAPGGGRAVQVTLPRGSGLRRCYARPAGDSMPATAGRSMITFHS